MRVSDFDFDLPNDRIALRPASPRDSARLLVVRPGEALHEYGVELVPWDRLPRAAAIVAAVAHRAFKDRPVTDYLDRLAPDGVVTDVKSQFDAADLARRGVTVWRL